MKRTFPLLLAAMLCSAFLSGCVSRADADNKLAEACAAGVTALLPDGSRIDGVKSHKATASPVGPNYRHVTITGYYVDGWLEEEKEYECVFEESFAFLNSGYTASIYQVIMGDRVVGGAGNEILGSAQEFIKLNDAVRKVLYK